MREKVTGFFVAAAIAEAYERWARRRGMLGTDRQPTREPAPVG